MKNKVYIIEAWDKGTLVTVWRSFAYLDREKAEYRLMHLKAEHANDVEYSIITLPIAE